MRTIFSDTDNPNKTITDVMLEYAANSPGGSETQKKKRLREHVVSLLFKKEKKQRQMILDNKLMMKAFITSALKCYMMEGLEFNSAASAKLAKQLDVEQVRTID